MKITIHAKPNSKIEKVEKIGGDSFVVSVKEPPIKGMANEAIIKAVAKYFNVSASSVKIVSGRTSKLKIIEIQKNNNKKMPIEKKIFLILLGLFFAFNLATISDYGITMDEPLQHNIGSTTIDYIKGITNNEESARTDQIYYGPFFEVLNQYFGGWMMDIFGIGYVNAFHILILITATTGIYFLFKLVSLLFSEQIALTTSILLMLYPRFVAHSHYNSKDITLLVFFIIILYFLHRAFIGRHKKSVWFAGIFLGFGLATRVDIVLVIPVFFIPYFASLAIQKKISIDTFKEDIILSVKIISTILATVLVCWPILWQNPKIFFESFEYFLNHDFNEPVLYLGQIYNAKELPWHYAPLYLFIATPTAILILIGFGFLKLTKKIKADIFPVLFILTWIFLRIFFAIIPNASRYDGIRHFLMIVPPLMVIGALGFDFILEKSKKIGIVIGTIVLLILIIEFARIYPFGDSYFNEISRVYAPKPLENYFETDYWGSSYKQGSDWINKNAEPDSKICVPIANYLLQFYKMRQDLKIACGDDSDYIMILQRPPSLPTDFKILLEDKKQKPAFAINRFNFNILTILKNPKK